MEQKINILCIPSDTSGCGLHRSFAPHKKLSDLYGDSFNITIEYNPNWRDLEWLSTFDILHFHKGIFVDNEGFNIALDYCKQNNIVTIMDIDDYWDVGQFHPLYHIQKNSNSVNIIKHNLTKVDYVTTTTDIFANKIKKYNKNVKVFVNALCPNEMLQLKDNTNNSGRIRFGFIMGSSHEHDMQLVSGIANKLPREILDKIQFVLCGYDLRGTITEIYPNGERKQRNIKPEESTWFRYEKIVTDDYKIVSQQYKEFLLRFIPNIELPMFEKEGYKRCWTKTVDNFEYMKHYNNVDVLLVPLQETDFNSCKSELKFVESGMMNVAVVASNFGPYTIGSKNFIEKGGIINEDGNCILIDNRKAHKDWAKTIERLVKNPEYIKKLQENMRKHVLENYDINKITADRAEWYKNICKKNG